MSDTMHAAAPHDLPSFITAPGEADVLLTASAVFLVVLVLFLGSMYFWLHSIPERLAHGSSRHQFQLVAVLALLGLFTHNNAFWFAALLLALVPIPDFWTPLARMAESLTSMAARSPRGTAVSDATTTVQQIGAWSAPGLSLIPATAAPPQVAMEGVSRLPEPAGMVPGTGESAPAPHVSMKVALPAGTDRQPGPLSRSEGA
jgi:hypothetical protein